MPTSTTAAAQPRARRLIAALAIVAAIPLIMATAILAAPQQSEAAITSPFTKVFSQNTTGAIQIRGNTLMSCQTAAVQCAGARAGTNAGADNNDNNFGMTWLDIDSDSTTFNSSSSTVDLPTGASVLFAALTWGGNTTAGNTINNANYGTTAPVAAPTPTDAGTVKLAVPGGSGYQAITSSRTTFLSGTTGAYQGYADVTSIIQGAGNGSYTVANVQAGTGADRYAGWGLTIAYSNPTDPARNLTVFSGFGSVTGGNTVDLPVSGFYTPPSGAVRTTLGAISYEGDWGSTGDQMQLGNTTTSLQNVTDALHPVANSFTSILSDNGVDSSTRTPNYKNQLGYDAATFNVNGFLGNNTTSANIRLTSASGGETYYPGVVTFATDLYSPHLSATKSVQLVQKAPGNTVAGTPEPGDTLRYTIQTNNSGQDDSINTVLSDVVPDDTTYVPGTLTSGGTPLTDASGDDVGTYAAGSRTITVNLGTGATSTAGGTVVSGASADTVTFDVTIDNTITDGETIENTANITYTGSQTGVGLTGASNAVVAAAVRHRSDLSITNVADKTTVQKGSGTQVTYVLTATNAGPYDDPNVVVTDSLPAGAVLVSATPSAGSCSTTSGSVSCAIGTLASGDSATVSVVVTLDSASDPASSVATVAGDNPDPTASNNSASVGTAVNTAPVANNDSATTTAGVTTIDVIGNDTDSDSDPLTVTLPGSPSHGTAVVGADNSVTYTADAGWAGADSFTYSISDGRGGSSTATVAVTIPNAAPVATADTTDTTPGAAVAIDVLANDSDANIPATSQALTVSSVSQPTGSKGTVTIDSNGLGIHFTPSGTFLKGTATFTYTVSDGASGSDTATVTVTIPNSAPVAVDDVIGVSAGGSVTADVLANDSDANGDALTVTAITGAAHGTATITGTGSNTKIQYTPDAGWVGDDTITYTVSDGTTTTTAQLVVSTGNDAPTADDFAVSLPGGVASTVDVLAHATDPNGDTLTVSSLGAAGHGTVSVDGSGSVSYIPAADFAGTDSFTYTVSDGHGGHSTGTVSVTVANQAPVAVADSITVTQNGHVDIAVLGNDTDANNDTLVVTSLGSALHGTVTLNGNGSVHYVPTAGYTGSDTFTYVMSDGNGGTSTGTVSVSVIAGAPAALKPDTSKGKAGQAVTIDPLANDSAGAGATLVASSLCLVDPTTSACGSTVTLAGVGTWTILADGSVKFAPVAGYAGTAHVGYRVTDTNGLVSQSTLSATIAKAASSTTGTLPSRLPTTGSEAVPVALIGLLFLLLGALAFLVGRTRRSNPRH